MPFDPFYSLFNRSFVCSLDNNRGDARLFTLFICWGFGGSNFGRNGNGESVRGVGGSQMQQGLSLYQAKLEATTKACAMAWEEREGQGLARQLSDICCHPRDD